MRAIVASDVLASWEQGLGQGVVERGLTLLALARPDLPRSDLAAVSIGERDRQLLRLREALFGSRLVGLIPCPNCGEQLELEVDLPALSQVEAAPEDALLLREEGYELQLRRPDSLDLLACAEGNEAAEALLHRCIASARREGAPVAVEELPEAVIERAVRRLAEADPLADAHFTVSCASCAHAWSAPFDVVSFLWVEIEAWSTRLLQEVHVLATAYGWTERDILDLGPARRQRYLQMVGA